MQYLFVKVDFLEVLVEISRESCGLEFILGVVGKALLVELALEVLECEGIVEDGHVASGGSVEIGSLLQRGCQRGGSHQAHQDRHGTHDVLL